MFWIIVTIIIVGTLVIRAINNNTRAGIAIEGQKRQVELNSPEYKAQANVSLRYFRHLGELADCKIRIAERNIGTFNPPNFFRVSKDYSTGEWLATEYVITENKDIYLKNRDGDTDIRLVKKGEIVKMLQADIKGIEKMMEELEKDYQEEQKDYHQYIPEPLGIIKTKYELDEPFPANDDFFNEDNASSWSMYEERLSKLGELENILKRLRNPNTRKMTLEKIISDKKIKNDILIDDNLFERAVAIVAEEDKASASLLQRRLGIGYAVAARMIDEMEKRGIIGASDGVRPRQVLKFNSKI